MTSLRCAGHTPRADVAAHDPPSKMGQAVAPLVNAPHYLVGAGDQRQVEGVEVVDLARERAGHKGDGVSRVRPRHMKRAAVGMSAAALSHMMAPGAQTPP